MWQQLSRKEEVKTRGSKRRTEVKEASKRGDEVDKFLSSYEEDRGKKRGLETPFLEASETSI